MIIYFILFRLVSAIPMTTEPSKDIVPSNCDQSLYSYLRSGNLGETSFFPWMGTLRVHIVEGKKVTIAVTQIILVKTSFAIAHAHDTAKIHEGLKGQSKAMFIPSNSSQWFTTVKEIRVHPEYEFYTFNTLSLISLEGFEGGPVIQPACWPFDAFNSNGELYAIGFTDEHQLMEKVLFKLQYSDKNTCDEFYNRLHGDELVDGRDKPSAYHCAFGVDVPKNCAWENGMAIASNASGHWTLLGLSVSGPNCSFPGRFIDVNQFTTWIESFTTMASAEEMFDDGSIDFPAKRKSS